MINIAAIVLLLIGSVGMGLAKRYDWGHFNHFIWKSNLVTFITVVGVILAFITYGWYGFIPVIIAMFITHSVSGNK